MLKVYTETSPEIIQEIFPIKKQGQYNLRNQTHFVIRYIKSVNYGIKHFSLFSSKLGGWLFSMSANIKYF